MKSVIILGTGGNCIDILDAVNEINETSGRTVYECAGFLDDDESKWGQVYAGAEVLGPLDSALDHGDCWFVSGIGNSSNFWKKREVLSRTGVPLERFVTIVHPSASVSKMATLGNGVVVLQNATVASDVVVGNHVIVLPNAVVSHDGRIGDYSCVTAGVCISGGVSIGTSCYLGTNSAIINNVTIGDECLIGMGSVVTKGVQSNRVVVGVPARVLRKTIQSKD